MDDAWDSLLHLEENAFQEGVAEGTKASQEVSEARDQGVISGYDTVNNKCICMFVYLPSK